MRMIIPDLLPGTEYAIQVRADNGSTQSQWSNIYIVETTADATPPSVPEWDLTDGFASIGDTFVAIWQTLDMTEDHNLDFSHYEIELSDGTKSVVVRTTNTSYTLTFEQNGIFFGTPKPTILARVRSVDMVGNVSAWNTQKTATNPPPAAPANISVTSLYDSIKVSWAAVDEDDIRGYRVQVSRTSNVSNFTPVYEGPDTEYIHGTDQWLDDHWYRVYAVDKFGSVSSPTTSGAVRPKSSFEIDMNPPAVPTGLTAAIHNNPNGVGARAELHWSQVTPPSNDLGGFNIRWRELGGTEWTISNFPKDERSGAIQLPSAYKDYEFQIRSHDWSANYSAWSATIVGISPENAIPKAPTNFGVTVSNSTFVVTWDEVVQNIDDTSAEDISYYEVGAKPAVGEEVFFRTPDISFELSQDVNSYVFGTPQPTVTFRVRAVDTVGQGTWTSNISKSIPLPSSPTGLTGTTGANSVYLSWTPPAGTAPTKYYVYQGTSSGPTTLVGEVAGTSYLTIVNDTTPQYFSVRSVDNYGQMSAPVSAGPFVAEDPFYIDTTPPPVPTALAATIAANANGVGSRASVSWAMASPPEDLVGFYLSYKKGTDTHWSSATFDKAARNATVELQDAYAAHNFRILAVDRNGNESAWSSTVNATAPAPSAPPKTTGVASVAGRYDIRYTWTPSSAADLKNYEVTFSTSSTFATGNTTFHTGTAASLTVGGLSPSTTYYVRVRAVGSTGLNGPWSDTHTKATLAQITPGDIGAPTTGDLDAVDNRVDDVEVKVDESIKSYVAEYAVNSSETVAPTTGWSTATPARTPGSFIWMRTKVTYHDDTSSTTSPALLTGNTGAQGSQGIPGSPGVDGADGSSLFTWLKYADTPTTGMSDSPVGKTYMGISYNNTSATESSNYNDYAWSLIKGADGSDGADGIGISGTVVEYTKSTNGVTAPTTGWDGNIPATVAGEYLWTRTVTTYTDDSTSVAHSVARHGATGSPGANGRGITGTVIDYQKSNNGVDAPTTGTWTTAIPATSPGEYLWTRTTTSYTSAPTSVVSYSVARHGVTGQQGIQGPPGEDGQPTYTWIKYADDDAGSNMSDEPDGKTYIGIAYNKTTEVESTVPTEYKWSLILGPQGPEGPQGPQGSQGIQGPPGPNGATLYTWLKYANTTTPTPAQMSDSPVGMEYMGISYNNASSSESTDYTKYAWSKIKGEDGAPGTDGVGISTTTVTYAKSTNGVDAPSTGWSGSIPTTVAGEYLWTRTTINYTDGDTDIVHSVSRHGATGNTGRGIASTAVHYVKSSDGTTQPAANAGWNTSIPATAPGEFLWTRTTITYTSGTPATSEVYTVAAHGATGPQGNQGVPGPPGEDGQPTYTWIKYSANADGTGMVDEPTAETIYIGFAYNKPTQAESNIKTDYKWSLIQGPEGPAGADGEDGEDGANAGIITLTATSQVLSKPATSNTTSPVSTTITATATNTTIAAWEFSVDGGTFGAAPAWVTGTGNSRVITGSTMAAKTITVRARNADSSVSDTMTIAKVADGAKGDTGNTGAPGADGADGEDGADAYTVILTNEAATFAAGTTNAIAGQTAEVGIIAYKGTTQIGATVSSVGALPTGLTQVTTGSGGLNAKVVFTTAATLVAANGTIPINLTVDGKPFTKNFTFALSKTGATGPGGSTGTSVTAITPYYARITVGSTLPAQPTNQATPPSPWTATEPDYLFNTELYRTDRITYSNGTYAYTTRVKVSAYTAAVTAITAANGKNNIFFGGSAPTTATPGRPGDVFWVRSGNTITEQWLNTVGTGTTSGNTWLKQTLSENTIGLLNAGKISTGTIDTAALTLASSGVIQSANFDAAPSGFRLTATGMQIKGAPLTIGNVSGLDSALSITSGTNSKVYKNPLVWGVSANGTAGSLVVETPITFNNYMTRVHFTGYNYHANGREINFSVGFYSYSTVTFPQTEQNNYGTLRISARLAKTEDDRVVIILDNEHGVWHYTKLNVQEVVIGQASAPDSFKDGWSCTLTSDLSSYTILNTPPMRDIDDNFDATEAWRTPTNRTEINGGHITTDTIDVIKLKAGTTFTQNLQVASTFTVGTAASEGTIQSHDYVAGSQGWRLNKTNGLELNKGTIKADTIRAGNLGGPAGTNSVINITAGTNLIVNGGHMRSNTYKNAAGTDLTVFSPTTATAGWYIGNDGLHIVSGSVKANALSSDTLTSTTITLGTGGEIKAADWTINSSGITIPNGAINVASVNIGAADANGIINKATTISGDKINTGSIKSTNYNATTHTGWSINTSGAAEFANLKVWGNTEVGAGAANHIRGGGWENSSSTDGWGLRGDGKAYLQDAVIRGSITATGGTIGGFTINATTLVGSTSAGIIQGGTFRTTSSTTSGVHITQGGGIYGGGTSSPNFRVDLSGNTTIGGNTTISGTTNMSGTLTLQNAANLTFAGTGKITGGSGANTWTLGADGLSVPDGGIKANHLDIQNGRNLVPAMYADFEGNPTSYIGSFHTDIGGVIGGVNESGGIFGKQKIGFIWGGGSPSGHRIWFSDNSSEYNIDVTAGKQYIFSMYAFTNSSGVGDNSSLYVKWDTGLIQTLDSKTFTVGDDNPANAIRLSGVATAPAGATKAMIGWGTTTGSKASGVSIDGLQVEEKTGTSNEPSAWAPPSFTAIHGGLIRTGSIQSTALAKRPDGTDISDVPAWSINTAGSAVLGEAQVLGRIVVGQTGNTQAGIKSYNFDNTAGTGWQIDADGHATFNDATIRGDVVANTFKTAESGQRVEIEASDKGTINFYPPSALVQPATISTNFESSYASLRLRGPENAEGKASSISFASGTLPGGGSSVLIQSPNAILSLNGNSSPAVHLLATGSVTIKNNNDPFASPTTFDTSGNLKVADGDVYAKNFRSVTGTNLDLRATGSSDLVRIFTGGGSNPSIICRANQAVEFRGGVTMEANQTVDGDLTVKGGLQNTNIATGNGDTITYNAGNSRFRRNTSSRRYKTDIRPYDDDIENILALEPKRYKRLDADISEDPREIGFIAEEAYDLGLDEFVTYEADGQISGFMYHNYVVALQHVARHQRDEIESLKSERDSLENRLAAIEQHLGLDK